MIPLADVSLVTLRDDPPIASAWDTEACTLEVVPTMTPPDPVELRPEQAMLLELPTKHTVVDGEFLKWGLLYPAKFLSNGLCFFPVA